MEYNFEFFKNIVSDLKSTTKIKVFILIALLIYAIFYFIKNRKILNYQLKILMPFFILICFGLIYFEIAVDIKFKSLLTNFNLTTGRINSYFISKNNENKWQSTNRIAYLYNCNRINFQNSYYENSHVNLPDVLPDLTLNYIVIYQKTNPKNSFILLNYPCNQNDELLNFQKIFQNKLPNNVFRDDKNTNP